MKDLRKQNISLMVKWWWKLDTQKGIWQDIIKARYLSNKTVAMVGPRFSDSPCWKALLMVKEIYMIGRKIKLGSGALDRLWKDSINGITPFCDQFPRLFDICNEQDCTVDSFDSISISSLFRRRLDPNLTEQWHNMCNAVSAVQRSPEKDSVYWGLNKSA